MLQQLKIYLNHNFELIRNELSSNICISEKYICKKCNCKIIIFDDECHEILQNYKYNNIILFGDILTLTCEEYIIKGVIE